MQLSFSMGIMELSKGGIQLLLLLGSNTSTEVFWDMYNLVNSGELQAAQFAVL